MNRADRLEAALRTIVETGDRHDPFSGFAMGIARSALDIEYPWPGEVQYNAPEDYDIAYKWMLKHEKADEHIFVNGRPVVALYYEPVAEHYQGARQFFRKLSEKFRSEWEQEWVNG
jgi:hypothetical protein